MASAPRFSRRLASVSEPTKCPEVRDGKDARRKWDNSPPQADDAADTVAADIACSLRALQKNTPDLSSYIVTCHTEPFGAVSVLVTKRRRSDD